MTIQEKFENLARECLTQCRNEAEMARLIELFQKIFEQGVGYGAYDGLSISLQEEWLE